MQWDYKCEYKIWVINILPTSPLKFAIPYMKLFSLHHD